MIRVHAARGKSIRNATAQLSSMIRPQLRFRFLCYAVLCVSALPLTSFSQTTQDQNTLAASQSAERQRAIQLYNRGDLKSAIAILKLLVKRVKDDYHAWYFLGLALNREDKIKDARKAFETVVKLRPDFAEGHTAFAYLLARSGRMDNAFDEAHKALELNNNNATTRYVLALVANSRGADTDALEQLELSLKINPNFGSAYLLKSHVLLSLYLAAIAPPTGKELAKETKDQRTATVSYLREAVTSLEKFLQLEPNSKNAEFWREQLKTLQAHANASPREIFFGRDVTTKAQVLKKPAPDYSASAKKALIKGTVILRAVFGADGKVQHILVVRSLPYGLTEAAVEAARRIKFVPATKDGRAVSMYIQLEYNFDLY